MISDLAGTKTSPLPSAKSDFIGLEGCVHLATGGEPPLLKCHRQAFERFAADKARGFSGYHAHWTLAEEVRGQVARLVGLEAGDVAFLGNASDGIERVVSGIGWRAGDNVVVPEMDYASGRYALANLKKFGVEVRLVGHDGWQLFEDRLISRCDQRTRLTYISQVNALTGQHVDIARISAALSNTETALLVDASHALGAVPVRGDHCDFLVSSTYKFLLGTHQGIFTWNRSRYPNFQPSCVGWWSADPGTGAADFVMKADAKRTEYGNVGHLGLYLLQDSIAYLEHYGIEAVALHVRALSGRMVEGMLALGLDVMTPIEATARAANAAFVHAAPEQVVAAAERENILIWGDQGRVRASAHLFTTEEDVETFLERLPHWI